MRFKIICILLALLALESEPRAATLCKGIGSDADIQLTAQPGFKFPAAWDDAKFPTVRVTPGKGAVAWWYTSDGFEWTRSWAFCTGTTCVNPLLAVDLSVALASADRLGAINSVLAKYNTLSVDAPEALQVWCPHWDEMQRSRPANPAYVVAKNGTSTTRPAFAYTPATASTAASRSTKSTARATVGATCDCKVRLLEGTTLYCATNVERTLVAVCNKP